MHLSPDDIAAAEACGVSFLPASAAQVQRLAMQRKVFYQAGAPILATRGDGFFETVGTLQQLIEEGRAQQRDLAQWLQPEATAAASEVEVLAVVPDLREIVPVPAPVAAPEPARPAEASPDAGPDTSPDAGPDADVAEAAPKRPRQKRRRAPVVPWVDPAAAPQHEPAESEPAEPDPAAVPDPAPALAGSPDPGEADSPARLAARTASDAQSAEERGKRWLMAGAARRGRAGKHWSTRQR